MLKNPEARPKGIFLIAYSLLLIAEFKGSVMRIQKIILIGFLAIMLSSGCVKKKEKAFLYIHSGNFIRLALEELVKAYKKEKDVRIEVDYGGSGEMLIKMDLTRKGDVFICHDPFLGAAEVKGFVDKSYVLGYMYPVIAVRKGNPKEIRSMEDLIKPGIRVGLTDPEYSTTGHIVDFILDKSGLRGGITKNLVMRSKGGGDVANALKLGTIDAGIVWDVVVARYKGELEAIPIDEQYRPKLGVDAVSSASYGKIEMGRIRGTIASLVFSKNKKPANDFAEYAVSEKGKAVFIKHGFKAE